MDILRTSSEGLSLGRHPASEMEPEARPAILKIGGSMASKPEDLDALVAVLEAEWKRHPRLVVVCSAFRGVTDRLNRQAPAGLAAGERAQWLASGEAVVVETWFQLLSNAGFPVSALAPCDWPLVAEGPRLDADPVALSGNPLQMRGGVSEARIWLVPGFVARTIKGEPCLLGRGGSDLTAVFLAWALGARSCRLLKASGGIFPRAPLAPRPALSASKPAEEPFRHLPYPALRKLEQSPIQAKALAFAERHRVSFRVTGLTPEGGTTVGFSEVLP
ncbi:MAG: hypothetical protein DWQ01_11540 [Planctomycetota bacterium]|nr:MAG: hypothetical protein DWQ01_11540 [Planctomycetota bacterium]